MSESLSAIELSHKSEKNHLSIRSISIAANIDHQTWADDLENV